MVPFGLKILAATRVIYDALCYSLRFETTDGSYGILAHHTNMVAAMSPGPLTLLDSAEQQRVYAISSGFLKVEGNTVLILAETVESYDEIDENRAQAAREAAAEALLRERTRAEYRLAQAKMARALSRIKVKHQFINH